MSYDIIGNIAIIYPPVKDLDAVVEKIRKHNKFVKAIYLKTDKLEGELRLPKLKLLWGEPILETIYKENKCVFKLRVDKVYFSPRLSTERRRILEFIEDGEKILIPFSGVNPYPVVIRRFKDVYIKAVEINPWAVKYAIENVRLNKLDNIDTILGDFRVVYKYIGNLKDREGIVTKYLSDLLEAKPDLKRIYIPDNIDADTKEQLESLYEVKSLSELKPKLEVFDRVIMPLPKGGEEFLEEGITLAKKSLHLYTFAFESEIEKKVREIIEKASKFKEVKKVNYQIVGDVGVRNYRIRVDLLFE